MKKKSLILVLVLFVLVTGCSKAKQPSAVNEPQVKSEMRTVTDQFGRQVQIPKDIKKIVCTGCGALRLVTYAEATDLLIGIEDIDKKKLAIRPYNFVNYEKFKKLPSIGKGSGRGYTAYDEQIILLQPDLILSSYTQEGVEKLAAKTGIPVVSVSYKSDMLDPSFRKALTLVGQILGKEKRCQNLVSYLEKSFADLDQRTKKLSATDKPSVYAGAVTYHGGQGFGGTYGHFGPFTVLNTKSVVDTFTQQFGFQVNLEQILVWNPDYIFLDPGNMHLVNEEYKKNPKYFNSLKAVQQGNVYAMISYNNYTTNIELALADSYFAGKILYPQQFKDVNIEKKTAEILEKFLGTNCYPEMKKYGLEFGKIKIGQQ